MQLGHSTGSPVETARWGHNGSRRLHQQQEGPWLRSEKCGGQPPRTRDGDCRGVEGADQSSLTRGWPDQPLLDAVYTGLQTHVTSALFIRGTGCCYSVKSRVKARAVELASTLRFICWDEPRIPDLRGDQPPEPSAAQTLSPALTVSPVGSGRPAICSTGVRRRFFGKRLCSSLDILISQEKNPPNRDIWYSNREMAALNKCQHLAEPAVSVSPLSMDALDMQRQMMHRGGWLPALSEVTLKCVFILTFS
ncbi:uncharacterized protein LOC129678423 [Psammomys obesus]|uniref:uncharacterized protein LOC129678423 n=1 Tax=Psammomys obesus TaxID=48139 RepID=UPI00245281B1|nr:uncharacterized protein LOC129678423 [Psammomys obesus]